MALTQLAIAIRATLDEWLTLRWSDLIFAERWTAQLVFVVLLAITALALLMRGLAPRRAGRTHVVLPAVLPLTRRSRFSALRHSAFVVFLAGVPFFAVALADPRTAFRREEVSYPGRRIAILVDGSTSMILQFKTTKLKIAHDQTFFTAVAATEQFIRLRRAGPYRDLIALLQFGNDAYVVTPFTTDYDNILLSTRLIGAPGEWGRFSDGGTTIIQGIVQATELFHAFDFQNAPGNLMLIFSDGRDAQNNVQGQSIEAVMTTARNYRIPVYMIRTAFTYKYGDIREDAFWRRVVESTGGRFYAADNEDTLLKAIADIDKLSPGRIDVRQYTSQRPRFAGYTLLAVALWLTAAAMKLGIGYFRTFP
jgi:Ca-activated chloride channel family protein